MFDFLLLICEISILILRHLHYSSPKQLAFQQLNLYLRPKLRMFINLTQKLKFAFINLTCANIVSII
jgi:hypothetical protein